MKNNKPIGNNKPIKKKITLLLLLCWMGVIFCFSSQNGERSGGLSHGVGYRIAELGNRLLSQEKKEEELAEQAKAMQLFIRKGAHMTEYALLSILFWCHLGCYSMKPGRRFWLSVLFPFLFAVTDECHQLFVPGREGRFWDVCIDTAGAVIGSCVMYLGRKVLQRE